jgi:hypothetical protein
LLRDEDGDSLANVDQTRRAISKNAQVLIFKSNDWELAKNTIRTRIQIERDQDEHYQRIKWFAI